MVVSGAFCPGHAALREAQNRGNSDSRGYDSRWRRTAKRYLQLNPLCVVCAMKNLIVPAVVVNHRIPVRVRPDLFWDIQNYESMCLSCHAQRTREEDKLYPKQTTV